MGDTRREDIGVESKLLFPREHKDWNGYASDTGCLRLRPFFHLCESGLAGTLALGNPPATEDIDAWEGSKKAGVWDYYTFLGFSVIPKNDLASRELVLYFGRSTVFDRPLEVVARLPIVSDHDVIEADDDDEMRELEWDLVRNALRKNFGDVDLGAQIWTVNGTKFTVAAPDQ